jgi:peptidoglycan/LPS O-acetylase OafA/YrhL
MPGLHGLRAVAIVAVLVYHLDSHLLPGGYLGVDIFFVISGCLITALLLAEVRAGRAGLRRFWSRRARRLLPALTVFLVGTVLLAALFARDGLSRMRVDALSSVFYVFNWRLITQHDSYLGSFGRPPLLLHLWSLSVEEQFYLLWPLLLLALRRRLGREQLAGFALGGGALSALLMALLYNAHNPSAVYFATPTHAEGLLIGAALAAAVPPWTMSAVVPPPGRRFLEITGVATLVVVLAGLAALGFDSAATYRGGMLAVDIASAGLVLAVAHPASRLGPVFAREPLRWLGLRSYSLYLWHWPIFEMTRPGTDTQLGIVPAYILRLVLTCAAAELSYRFVEQPWRTGRAQSLLRSAWVSARRRRLAWAFATPAAAVVLVLASAPASSEPSILAEDSTGAARLSPSSASLLVRAAPSGVHLGPVLAALPGIQAAAPAPTLPGPPGVTPAQASQPASPTTTVPGQLPQLPILAIGDSVLLAASPVLQSTFGSQITVDAVVGRQVPDGLNRLADYRASNVLDRYRTVVVDLGTNGAFEPDDFQRLVSLVAGVPQVILFDVHADRSWVSISNATITAGVAAHSGQMRLADWNRAASDPNLLYGDAIHPNDAGARVYSQLLMRALTG